MGHPTHQLGISCISCIFMAVLPSSSPHISQSFPASYRESTESVECHDSICLTEEKRSDRDKHDAKMSANAGYGFQSVFQSFLAKYRSCEFSLSSVRCSPDTVKSLQDFVDRVTAIPLPLAFPSRLRLRSIFSSASSSPASWRVGESLRCRVLPPKSTRGSTN